MKYIINQILIKIMKNNEGQSDLLPHVPSYLKHAL